MYHSRARWQSHWSYSKTKGLYHVAHDQPKEANSADEELSLDQFHHRMGHILTGVARKLVEKGFVTGVHLESTASSGPFFCESCVYAKATQKLVPKLRDGECANKFGDEIHSDLWGPAPVATREERNIILLSQMTCLT